MEPDTERWSQALRVQHPLSKWRQWERERESSRVWYPSYSIQLHFQSPINTNRTCKQTVLRSRALVGPGFRAKFDSGSQLRLRWGNWLFVGFVQVLKKVKLGIKVTINSLNKEGGAINSRFLLRFQLLVKMRDPGPSVAEPEPKLFSGSEVVINNLRQLVFLPYMRKIVVRWSVLSLPYTVHSSNTQYR